MYWDWDKALWKSVSPVFFPTLAGQRIYWLYLIGALALALVVYLMARRSDGFLRWLFPKSVWGHPSAVVDYAYFLVNKGPVAVLVGYLILGGATATEFMVEVFSAPGGLGLTPGPLAGVLHAVLGAVAMDLAIFVTHLLQHRVPLLWEFHKVHHSAEVLTPITIYRMHPIDIILTASTVSLFVGAAHGILALIYGAVPANSVLFGINAGLFIYYVAGYNLRHSHVRLGYPKALSHILVSPLQHQVHHSCRPEHIDRNFGFALSLWDWLAGTLYVPAADEPLTLGLTNGEHEDYRSVWRLYSVPFVKATARLRAARRQRQARPASPPAMPK